MTEIHKFSERLRYSEAASDEPFWDAVYRKAFPDMVNMMPCPGDTKSQRMGIDRLVLLASGRVLKIDEKKRSKMYDDILLEYISVDTTGAPGWIEKQLVIDYLAYAFMQNKRVYLYPWDMLRRAWIRYKVEWIQLGQNRERGFSIITARNPTYNTISVAVPIKSLQLAVRNAGIIQL